MADVMSELDREEVCVINVDAAGHPINYNIVWNECFAIRRCC